MKYDFIWFSSHEWFYMIGFVTYSSTWYRPYLNVGQFSVCKFAFVVILLEVCKFAFVMVFWCAILVIVTSFSSLTFSDLFNKRSAVNNALFSSTTLLYPYFNDATLAFKVSFSSFRSVGFMVIWEICCLTSCTCLTLRFVRLSSSSSNLLLNDIIIVSILSQHLQWRGLEDVKLSCTMKSDPSFLVSSIVSQQSLSSFSTISIWSQSSLSISIWYSSSLSDNSPRDDSLA